MLIIRVFSLNCGSFLRSCTDASISAADKGSRGCQTEAPSVSIGRVLAEEAVIVAMAPRTVTRRHAQGAAGVLFVTIENLNRNSIPLDGRACREDLIACWPKLNGPATKKR